MSRLRQIVVDCEHPAALARFWAAALDDFVIRPYDEAEISRLAARGLTPETDPVVILDGPGLELCFQQVALERGSKVPVHLDIDAEDLQTEVDRLIALGGSVRQHFDQHTWMLDPEGNDFCVVQARTAADASRD